MQSGVRGLNMLKKHLGKVTAVLRQTPGVTLVSTNTHDLSRNDRPAPLQRCGGVGEV